jgi:glycosyltransferase involved in cell wall biosynthesis
MSSGAATACSVVIDNYNNAAFIRDAIDSALAQEDADVEVVVVDDGSTDDSPEIIRSYGDRVDAVLKENGGQGSALNAGFAASGGDVVIFLDSDDRLEPWAARTAVHTFDAQPGASRLHWPLREMDADGAPTGEVHADDVEEGDFAAHVLGGGPYTYRWASTSGNAWPRAVLEEILPVDESAFTQAVDNYLSALAPLYGPVIACESMTWWRRHGANDSTVTRPFHERLEQWLIRFDALLTATEDHAARRGLPFDPEAWLRGSWFHRMHRAVRVIEDNVPAGTAVILLDQDSWEVHGSMRGRPCIPFPEWKGAYAGPPADEEDAVERLESMAAMRRAAVAVAWPCFWWLEYYGLGRFLTERFRPVAETPDVHLFLPTEVGSANG